MITLITSYTTLKFKVGDRVTLCTDMYGHASNQGSRGQGTVVEAGPDHRARPGALKRPYLVKWDSDPTPNSYLEADLRAARTFEVIECGNKN